jgi:hypothetical protein
VDSVGRDLHVRSIGSGAVGHHGVAGAVDIPRDDG